MKSKLTVRQKPMKNRSRLFLIYTAAFLLCAAGVYACFIVKGRSLVVSGDGWKQHFTAFVYFGQYGRTVLRTLLKSIISTPFFSLKVSFLQKRHEHPTSKFFPKPLLRSKKNAG